MVGLAAECGLGPSTLRNRMRAAYLTWWIPRPQRRWLDQRLTEQVVAGYTNAQICLRERVRPRTVETARRRLSRPLTPRSH